MEILDFVDVLMLKYPAMRTIMFIFVTLRLVNKPLFSALKKFADLTQTQVDNKVVDKVLNSQAYKIISYVLDLGASVKLPSAKKKGQ